MKFSLGSLSWQKVVPGLYRVNIDERNGDSMWKSRLATIIRVRSTVCVAFRDSPQNVCSVLEENSSSLRTYIFYTHELERIC